MAEKLYGYVGKIARINLTDKSVELIPTSKYVPKYIGVRSVCIKYSGTRSNRQKAFDGEQANIYSWPDDGERYLPAEGPCIQAYRPSAGRSITPGGIGGWLRAE
jgi:aldehyde:ferredoxin oxidoreductase